MFIDYETESSVVSYEKSDPQQTNGAKRGNHRVNTALVQIIKGDGRFEFKLDFTDSQ